MSEYEVSGLRGMYLRQVAPKLFSGLIKATTESSTFNEEGLSSILADGRTGLYFWTHSDIVMDHVFTAVPIAQCGGTIPRFVADKRLSMRGTREFFKSHGVIYIERNGRLYESYRQMYEYLKHGVPIGISEQPGRAKDGIRYTDPGIVGYFVRSSGMKPLEFTQTYATRSVAISYEWKPDAQRMAQQVVEGTKMKHDDGLSIVTGIFGKKGRVHTVHGDSVQGDDIRDIARQLDEQNTSNLALWPSSFTAAAHLRQSHMLNWELLTIMERHEQDRAMSYVSKVNELPAELRRNVHALHAGRLRDESTLERAVEALCKNDGMFPVFLK